MCLHLGPPCLTVTVILSRDSFHSQACGKLSFETLKKKGAVTLKKYLRWMDKLLNSNQSDKL